MSKSEIASRHRWLLVYLGSLVAWSGVADPIQAQEAVEDVTAEVTGDEEAGLSLPFEWERGPTVSNIGDTAQIQIPEGYIYTGAQGTKFLLEAMENPTNGTELGIIMPQSEDESWFICFEFSDVGYVNDDDRDSLDAEAMLKSIQEGTEAGNAERRSRGWAPLDVLGWQQPPALQSRHELSRVGRQGPKRGRADRQLQHATVGTARSDGSQPGC